MFRFIFFVFLLGAVVYFAGSWIIKWITSTKQAIKRKERDAWRKYDKKINPGKKYSFIKNYGGEKNDK